MCQPDIFPRIATPFTDWDDMVNARILIPTNYRPVFDHVVIQVALFAAYPADTAVSDI